MGEGAQDMTHLLSAKNSAHWGQRTWEPSEKENTQTLKLKADIKGWLEEVFLTNPTFYENGVARTIKRNIRSLGKNTQESQAK